MSSYFAPQKLKTNLTGKQITDVLDGLDRQMVYHLTCTMDILTPNLVSLLSWCSHNRKKRISSLSFPRQMQTLYFMLQYPDITKQYTQFTKLRLDRSILRVLVKNLLASCASYERAYLVYVESKCQDSELDSYLQKFEQLYGCSRKNLYPMLQNLRLLSALSYDFRSQLVGKYYKLISTLVTQHINESRRHIDYKECFQNFALGALKALDRYDASKGALTSYIRLWLRSVQQNVDDGHEYGVAFDIPANQKFKRVREGGSTSNNFSTSLDDLVAEGETVASELIDDSSPEAYMDSSRSYVKLLQLAKYADPLGVGRLSLGIEEYFEGPVLAQVRALIATCK